MATLLDNELFDYLAHLEGEVDKRINDAEKDSLRYLMHVQMRDIIGVEKKFLKYVNSNGTQPVLSISPNGLPSVESLNPDLEKMCELAEDEESFVSIAQRLKKGIRGKNKEEGKCLYAAVPQEDWRRELKNHRSNGLTSKIGFEISETEDGKFELAMREDIHLQGYDQHSKEFPVLVREGKMWYHIVWNRLLDDSEESFYVPNTAMVLSGKTIRSPDKIFDDVNRRYNFKKSDFQLVREPFLWWTRGVMPKNYPNLVAAGTHARAIFTERILETLTDVLGRRVNLKGVNREDLYDGLSFPNNPKEIPKEKEVQPKQFELVSGSSEPVGRLSYLLPCLKAKTGAYGGTYHSGLHKGRIDLSVLGNVIETEPQYIELQRRLERKRLLR